jgi:hypothetical protein
MKRKNLMGCGLAGLSASATSMESLIPSASAETQTTRVFSWFPFSHRGFQHGLRRVRP